MKNFHLRILAADHPFYDGQCESLVFPTTDGKAGIQAGFENMFCAVSGGLMTFRVPEEKEAREVVVTEGMLRVENGDVLVLVDTAEKPEEIDENRARRDLEAAREEMTQHNSILEYHTAQARVARAMVRLAEKKKSGI